jgi:hypothetical protein
LVTEGLADAIVPARKQRLHWGEKKLRVALARKVLNVEISAQQCALDRRRGSYNHTSPVRGPSINSLRVYSP